MQRSNLVEGALDVIIGQAGDLGERCSWKR
jgi:hypothetical protein